MLTPCLPQGYTRPPYLICQFCTRGQHRPRGSSRAGIHLPGRFHLLCLAPNALPPAPSDLVGGFLYILQNPVQAPPPPRSLPWSSAHHPAGAEYPPPWPPHSLAPQHPASSPGACLPQSAAPLPSTQHGPWHTGCALTLSALWCIMGGALWGPPEGRFALVSRTGLGRQTAGSNPSSAACWVLELVPETLASPNPPPLPLCKVGVMRMAATEYTIAVSNDHGCL